MQEAVQFEEQYAQAAEGGCCVMLLAPAASPLPPCPALQANQPIWPAPTCCFACFCIMLAYLLYVWEPAGLYDRDREAMEVLEGLRLSPAVGPSQEAPAQAAKDAADGDATPQGGSRAAGKQGDAPGASAAQAGTKLQQSLPQKARPSPAGPGRVGGPGGGGLERPSAISVGSIGVSTAISTGTSDDLDDVVAFVQPEGE